jgi:hypothetical protein
VQPLWQRGPRWDTSARAACLGLFLLCFPVLPGVFIETTGTHKHWDFAWDLPEGDSRVLGAKMVYLEGIYLYIDTGRDAPWPVVLPWDNEMADEIQKQMDEALPDSKGQFMMRYEPSLDLHAPQFHPLPQPPLLPPKPRRERAPHIEGEA